MASRTGKPPRHGQMVVSGGAGGGMKREHARQHLAMMVETTNTTRDYGAHGTGFSSQGSLTPSGSSGADYQTTGADSVGDCDRGHPPTNESLLDCPYMSCR